MESTKDIVIKFYQSAGILSKNYCLDILHEDVQLEWYSSKGHLFLDKNDILALSKDLRLSYFDLRAEIHQVIEGTEGEVIIFYSYYVRTFENPDEEMILATFFTIWHLKEGKFFRGTQMSQLGKR